MNDKFSNWSDEEIEFLKIYFPHKNNDLLQSKLREINLANGRDIHRTTFSISNMAHRLKLRKTDYYRRQVRFQRVLKIKKEKQLKILKQIENQKEFITLPQNLIKNSNKYER